MCCTELPYEEAWLRSRSPTSHKGLHQLQGLPEGAGGLLQVLLQPLVLSRHLRSPPSLLPPPYQHINYLQR